MQRLGLVEVLYDGERAMLTTSRLVSVATHAVSAAEHAAVTIVTEGVLGTEAATSTTAWWPRRRCAASWLAASTSPAATPPRSTCTPPVLSGRVVADTLTNAVGSVIIVAVGLAEGYRPRNFGGLVGGFLLLLMFALLTSFIFALVGLFASNVQTVNAATFPVVFPLTLPAARSSRRRHCPRGCGSSPTTNPSAS